METLGARIAALRKAKGFTQEDLATQMGVSAQAVSKWENDISCPDIQLLPKLGNVLNTTIDYLLTGHTQEVTVLPRHQRKPLEELTLKIKAFTADGDKVRINLPLSLVKVGLELGIDISSQMPNSSGMDSLKNIDLSKLVNLAEQGMIGKIVDVESADGDIVEIVVE